MKHNKLVALAGMLALLGVPAAATAQAKPAAAAPSHPPAVKHELTGRDNCMMCHAVGVMEKVPDVPADHAGRGNETCLWCHAPNAAMQTRTPKPIDHTLEGRSNCLMCHKEGAMPGVPAAPADHAGRENTTCQMCHKTPA
jgi:hypothetical protein